MNKQQDLKLNDLLFTSSDALPSKFISLSHSFFLCFQLCLLRTGLVIANRGESKNYVELFDPNDHSKFKCWPVPTCQEGQQPSVEPGSVHTKTTAISCIPCDHGWFSNHDTNQRCQKCISCARGNN